MVAPLIFDLNARRDDNETRQLYSNNRGLDQSYLRENTISQLYDVLIPNPVIHILNIVVIACVGIDWSSWQGGKG